MIRIILFSLIFLFSISLFAQIIEDKQNNHICLDLLNIESFSDSINLSFLHEDLKNKKIVFRGIAEGVAINDKINLALIKYLSKNFQLRNVLLEMGYSDAFLLNRLIIHSDTSIVKDYFYFKEFKEFIEHLRQFNEQLSEDKKIHLWGVDFERISSLVKMIQFLIPSGEEVPETIRSFVDTLTKLKPEKFNVPAKKFIQFLREKISKNEKDYLTFFGEDNFLHIKMALFNNAFYENMGQRNKEFYHNFQKYIKYMQEGIIYGVFGTNHTILNFKPSFAYQLNNVKESPFFNRVISINTHYENALSYYNGIVKIEKSHIEHSVKDKKNIHQIKNYINDLNPNCEIKLIKLPHQNSLLSEIYPSGQYLFFLKNQKPVTPLKVK